MFLVYFCVLREENEVDTKLRMTLYDHIEGLEEKQLEISLEHTTDKTAIIERLEELRAAKQTGLDSRRHKDD